MSFWGKLAGIGIAAAGVATGQPALIGAGASVFTGDMASEASKGAAKTQSDAADKALGVNQQVHDDTRKTNTDVYNRSNAVLAPFVSTGSSAMGSLGSLLGLPAAPAGVTAALSPVASPTGAIPLPGSAQPTDKAPMQRAPETAQSRAAMSTASAYQPPTLGGMAGGMVPMLAPDGTVQSVPSNQVAFYASKGARPLDSAPTGATEVR